MKMKKQRTKDRANGRRVNRILGSEHGERFDGVQIQKKTFSNSLGSTISSPYRVRIRVRATVGTIEGRTVGGERGFSRRSNRWLEAGRGRRTHCGKAGRSG
jgi:hypothetical protein